MGDLKKAAVFIGIGILWLLINYFTGNTTFSDYGLISLTLIAIVLVIGCAFFVRGKNKWWNS